MSASLTPYFAIPLAFRETGRIPFPSAIMCPNALLRTARAIVPWAMPLLLTNTVQAQVTNVDIDLAPGSDADQMEVRMRFNGSGFGEVFSGLVFTIRWDASSPALLPLGTPFCTGAAFPIGASPHVEDGGYRYRT